MVYVCGAYGSEYDCEVAFSLRVFIYLLLFYKLAGVNWVIPLLCWNGVWYSLSIFSTSGKRGEVFHRNRGEQPDERAKDRSPIFLISKKKGAISCIAL